MKRLILTLFAAAHCAAALAQDYPSKPVTVVVTFAAGGSADSVARMIAPELSEALGQPIVIVNRPGSGGNLGADYVAKAPKDGYTLLLGSTASNAINVTLFDKLPYNAMTDFDPISMVAQLSPVLVAHASLPFNTLSELVAYAKVNPGKLNFASGGMGTTAHLAGEWFKSAAKLDLMHVPYKGAGSVMTDQLAGRVDLQFDLMTTALQNIKSGKLKAIALPAAKRSTLLPNVPTFAEEGYPELSYSSWFALYAPAGTPAPIIARLNQDMSKVLSMPKVKERMLATGTEPRSSTVQELRQFNKLEIERWSKVVKASGAKAD